MTLQLSACAAVQDRVISLRREGWERGGNWGDVSFMMEQGQHIEKMVIVGDEKWKDDAFAFTAKGFRATTIEFFTPARLNEALSWLNS